MSYFFFKALAAPLLLKAKETSELSSETCAALHLCLEMLSKQEEVWKCLHLLYEPCASMYNVRQTKHLSFFTNTTINQTHLMQFITKSWQRSCIVRTNDTQIYFTSLVEAAT